MDTRTARAVIVGLVAPGLAAAQAPTTTAALPRIVSVVKIWDQGPHNAFTDLIRFQDHWYCTFRESDAHVGGDGRLRVLVSTDGEKWESSALLAEEGIDLRDPKLSITPDGRLMIVAGGSVYEGKKLLGRQPRVAFSKDGKSWTPTQRVLEEGEWMWRLTWHKGIGYGTVYRGPAEGSSDRDHTLSLWKTRDGVQYERVTPLAVTGRANETTLRFLPDDTAIALVRREERDQVGWIGVSKPPYKDWRWHETKHRLGGPNFTILPDGRMWAASRSYPGGAKTVVARFGPTTYEPVLTLPSGGDCSYPGLVWHDGLLWMSYYSSHEGKTSIYIAKIELPK